VRYEVAKGLLASVVALIATWIWVAIWGVVAKWTMLQYGVNELSVSLVGVFSPLLLVIGWAAIVVIKEPK